MSTEKKPPITCHILDNTAGRPAPNIPVTLTLLPPPSSASASASPRIQFHSTTNADGRVLSWTPTPTTAAEAPSTSLAAVFAAQQHDQRWSIACDMEAYFANKGVATFFPEIEVKFVVRAEDRERGDHFHVPLLVSGAAYTTYRGS
ncbi:hypothetical protein J1614_003352 [Plenodomus biglobosus]|nr:hypothetical protein J1614_003352 [Plenodomus biglobosus]